MECYKKNHHKKNLVNQCSKLIKQHSTKQINNKSLQKNSNQNLKKYGMSLTKKIAKDSCQDFAVVPKIQSLEKERTNLVKRMNFRKTAPCSNNAAFSVSNQKKISQNTKSREKALKSLQNCKSKSNQAKTSSANAPKKRFVQIQKKLNQYTLAKQTRKKQQIKQKTKNEKRYFRKSTQIQITTSKSTSNNKISSKKQSDSSKIHKIPFQNTKLIHIFHNTESSTNSKDISKTISKTNSNEKHQFKLQLELNKIFKKKNESPKNTDCKAKKNLQKKMINKKNIYSSMKVSQRNSMKVQQSLSKEFLFCHEQKNPQKYNFSKCKQHNSSSKPQLTKIKSQNALDLNLFKKHIQEIIADFKCNSTQNDKISEKSWQGLQKFNRETQFSFKENCQNQKLQPHNSCQISIDRYLPPEQVQTKEPSFFLQCQQVLKERLSKISELQLEKIKEGEFTNLDKFQALNKFQSLLERKRFYSLSSQIHQAAQISQIDFTTLRYPFQKAQQLFTLRVNVVDWLSMLSSTMLLKNETFHLTVCYFDIITSYPQFFTQKTISSLVQLKLIGLGCLSIAIKMDERQYQHDILNAFQTLQPEFQRAEIVKIEYRILKTLKLKLKFQTLSFWIDFFSQKWDTFVLNCQTQELQQDIRMKLLLRSPEGKSYETYRKLLETINCILLSGGIFRYHIPCIVLSSIYSILQKVLLTHHQQKVLQCVSNFCLNSHTNSHNTSLSSNKQNQILNYATQQTLDQMSNLNESKQNLQCNESLSVSGVQYVMNGTSKKVLIKRNTINSRQQESYSTQNALKQMYSLFRSKYQKKQKCCQNIQNYVDNFSEIKLSIEIDQRIYQEAQTYEQFLRYHPYNAHSKIIVLKKYQQSSKSQNRPHKDSSLFFKTFNSQKQLSLRNHFNNDFNKDARQHNLDYYLHQEVDQVFSEKQIGACSKQ